MSNYAVRVRDLGKLYHIGAQQAAYQTLRETIVSAVSSPIRRTRQILSGQAYGAADLEAELWALKDLTFDIKHGDVVGIIGHNGAGKSTLLKLLSRITEPTTGTIDLYGRVGALLEVGTGFHQELTGRENIYLNGSILGMSRVDINRKFDEIVAFSGVEKFIDTPVKHYSSGMGLRLGFSVAAHLEPEILVVDEVLAVGDAEFQKKCLGKMSDVAGEGRTVLFVSHNMSAVSSLCTLTYWLNEGTIKEFGVTSDVIRNYLSHNISNYISVDLLSHQGRRGSHKIFQHGKLLHTQDERTIYRTDDPFGFEILCHVNTTEITKANIGFTIKNDQGHNITTGYLDQVQTISITKPEFIIRVYLDKLPLIPGRYYINLVFSSGTSKLDIIEDALTFEVIWNDTISLEYPPRLNWGDLYIPIEWDIDTPQ